ncbi:ATP-binding cassette domain-containing protein [uncultured Endozoicomonas sp.]|uniref:ATP-binding cassette domain-containing protein n=1 Tax=uncultured Endozoicomonas sp. TaxID=432652 RepID=UPI0026087470|nr:ATP-binding cassette domain-containing protein [uncultured Endozoicomonas sp.]
MGGHPVFQLVSVGIGVSEKALLSGVNLTIGRGDSFVLVGPSGGGKSSLLKLLLGGFHLQAGEFFFMGRPVCQDSIKHLRSSIAYIPQQAPSGGESVADYLSRPFSWKAWSDRPFRNSDVEYWFQQLDLSIELLSSSLNQLSGGQRQRLSMVRGLMTGRKILVADEPTSALDDESCRKVTDLLLGGDYTVVSASHDPRWITGCQHSILVRDGGVSVVDNPIREVMKP